MKIIHLNLNNIFKHFELENGIRFYTKAGFTNFKNYEVPDNFIISESNLEIILKMYEQGLTKSPCGTISTSTFKKRL